MRKKIRVSFTIVFLSVALSAFCWAGENNDHICFRSIDLDKDGVVTFHEFEKAHGYDEKKFNEMDEDGDGKITHDEYHHHLGHGSSK